MSASKRSLRTQKIYHLFMILFWVGMAFPSTVWWRESILLVILMSIYANAEASFSAYYGVSGQLERREDNGGTQHCCCCPASQCAEGVKRKGT